VIPFGVTCGLWPVYDIKLLKKDDGYKDNLFPGCQFRIQMFDSNVAVNVKITGKTPTRRNGSLWYRVKVEFVGDGEPSTFSGGWFLLNN
jgi:hypothetical protein